MCGIIGSVNKPIDQSVLETISHRGPDGRGWFQHESTCLGHVRLSIQDVSDRASQPFFSKDKQTILVFNGEIYNHWDIRKELEEVDFVSTSDTETVLEGYLKYGKAIFEKLNGIFALCIYDIIRQEVIIARDRFGIKPLYYKLDNNQLQFASELKAIDLGNDELDFKSISNYIRFLWSPGRRTPAINVEKLLPAEMLTVNLSSGELTSAKELFVKGRFDGNRQSTSEDELIDQAESLLIQAVERQLLSDVPVGFFLSGGLDSSLLVAMARKLNPEKKIQCFTIDTSSFAGSEGFSNDLDYAKLVAEHLNVDLEVVSADVNIVKDFDRMIWFLDEPQADPAPLNVYNISQCAAKMGYKVLIGGAGGDDIFSGYRRHQMLRYERWVSLMPSPLLKLAGAVGKMLIKPTSPGKRRIRKVIDTLNRPKSQRLFTYFDWMDWEVTKNLFTPKIKAYLDSTDPYEFFGEKLGEIPNERNLLNRMLHLEMNTFLVDHNFNYTDKMGMAAGVEIRVPFLDNDLVDFTYSLPPELKLNGNTTKYILKKVAERYLPHDVIYRPKAGFGAPVRTWITNDLRDFVSERLSKERVEERGIFDYQALSTLIQRNIHNQIDVSYPIWAILAIDSWVDQFYLKNENVPQMPVTEQND